MKGLFKRTGYFLLSSKLIIALSLFIGLSIFVPLIIGISYTPNVKFESLFGFYKDTAARVAIGKLTGFMFLMWIFLTAIILYIPLKIFSIDKETNWNIFLSATPVKRKSYVTEKYILTFILIIVLCLFYSVTFGVRQLIESKSSAELQSIKPNTFNSLESSIDIKSIILFVAVLMSVYLMFITFIFPVEFFNGSNKVMMYTISLVSGFFFFSVFITKANTSRKENIIKSFFSADPLIVAFGVLLFSCGLYFLSWMLSVKLYKKREF